MQNIKIKIINWWKNQLKTDFSKKNLFSRVALDIFLSNWGFFMGTFTTVNIWAFTWHTTPKAFFYEMFFDVWLANVPLLNFCCLFSYAANGLYRGTPKISYTREIIMVSKAVGMAFFLFLSWVYLTKTYMPRSTMVATLFFTFTVILLVRLLWTAFSRQYTVLPLSAYDPRIEQIVRELTVLSQQDGWVPPDKLSAKAAWPYFEDDEVLAAATVLRSGKINQWTGIEVEKFQEEFAAFCNVRHAIALSNGTVALELALKVLGIGPGDEVIVTPRTFIASAGCIVLQGAKPVFADVNPQSQNINAETIRKKITPRTKAIIAVHLAGWPCEMDGIMELAKEHGLKVIEDCAQAHGAEYKGKPVGSFGDLAAFSFCQDKIMTTGGEGGMLLTNNDDIWSFCWAYKDHGKSYDAVYHREHPTGFRWLHESFGTNWRMTEMQATIGRRQLKKLQKWVDIRRRNASILTEHFSRLKAFRVTTPPSDFFHSYYKYYVFVRPEELKDGWNRDRILNSLSEKGIPCFSGSCSEIYQEKAFDINALRPEKRLPVAQELGGTALMFLVHPTLTEEDMLRAADVVCKVMREASK